jgi:hypothetical protein
MTLEIYGINETSLSSGRMNAVGCVGQLDVFSVPVFLGVVGVVV